MKKLSVLVLVLAVASIPAIATVELDPAIAEYNPACANDCTEERNICLCNSHSTAEEDVCIAAYMHCYLSCGPWVV